MSSKDFNNGLYDDLEESEIKTKGGKSHRKGNFIVILALVLIIAIAVGYIHMRENGVPSKLKGLFSCAGTASDTDISSADVSSAGVSGSDSSADKQSGQSAFLTDEVSASDVSSSNDGDKGFFASIGSWFSSCGGVRDDDKAASQTDVSQADISSEDNQPAEPERSSVSAADVSESDVLSSDAENKGFFASVGNWFKKVGNWFARTFSAVVDWANNTFGSCRGQQSVTSETDISGADSDDPIDRGTTTLMWDVQGDDSQYKSMMAEKTDEYIGYLAELSALESTLSECRSAEQVRKNKDFAALVEKMDNWCGAALLYPGEALFSEDAQQIWQLSYDLAKATIDYLEAYPDIVTGKYEPADGNSADDMKNAVGEAAAQLYALLHGTAQSVSNTDAA